MNTCKTSIQKVESKNLQKHEELKSKIRTQKVCNARKFLIYILHTKKQFSYSSIGKLLNKNHSTIITSITKIKEEFNSNSKIRPLTSKIIEFILK